VLGAPAMSEPTRCPDGDVTAARPAGPWARRAALRTLDRVVLARAVALVHFGYLAYVLLGGFLARRWPRALLPHVAAVAWGVVSVGLGLPCPLTWLEDVLRRRAGAPPLGGFVDHYVEGVLYPERYTPLVLAAVAAVVLISWTGARVPARENGQDRPGPAEGKTC
jgi:hypothetical protein